MKKTIIYGLCLVIALMGSGCSDDEDTRVDTALLTGIWQGIASYDSDDVEDGYDGWDDVWNEYDLPCMVIHEDHYGYRRRTPTNRYDEVRFTWSCSNNRFSIYYDGEEATDAQIWVIEKLTDEELLWRADCYEDGYHWVEKELYRRYNP